MDEEWKKRGNCRGQDPNLFFEGFEDASLTDKVNIIKMCIECPVEQECLAYGNSFPDSVGIFGGKFFKKGKPIDPFRIRKSKVKV